jgi:hypothetical protein
MTTNSQWLDSPERAKTFSAATLFVEAPPVSKGLPAFLVSLLLHCAVISVLVLAFHAPRRSSTEFIPGKYTVRLIELQPPQILRSPAAAPATAKRSAPSQSRFGAGNRASSSDSATRSRLGAGESAGPAVAHRRFELPVLAQFPQARQTLVQLDAPPKLVMNIAVPDVLLWAQKIAPAPRRKLVPPPLREIPKPARTLLAPPTLDLPNQETNVADMRFTVPPATNAPKLPVPPTTTTPIKVDGPEEKGAQLPQTVSTNSSEESTAHVISISSLPLHADSLVIVPPANQIASSGNGQGQGSGESAGAGEAAGAATTGAGTADAPQAGAAVGANAGAAAGTGSAVQTLAGAGDAGGAAFGSAAFGGAGEGLATEALHRITQPKDGKFSVVVIGSSAAEAYPDSVGLMTGKVIYTVYLKVGLRKSWILQYCLPGPVEQQLRVKGSATPLDAPWPFLMLRPDLANSGADALMLHGLVNTDGRFEKLALVLPAGFPQKDLLVSSLRQWEFRPAKRDGQPIAVEVLLIIPEDTE